MSTSRAQYCSVGKYYRSHDWSTNQTNGNPQKYCLAATFSYRDNALPILRQSYTEAKHKHVVPDFAWALAAPNVRKTIFRAVCPKKISTVLKKITPHIFDVSMYLMHFDSNFSNFRQFLFEKNILISPRKYLKRGANSYWSAQLPHPPSPRTPNDVPDHNPQNFTFGARPKKNYYLGFPTLQTFLVVNLGTFWSKTDKASKLFLKNVLPYDFENS